MPILLGCIADDFTGATDLCNTLVKGGMRTVQLIDVPSSDLPVPDVDAITVALKSRTIPAAEAVLQSLAALDWLRRAGARQILFKYCSTFDSTDAGNIGPVADALLDALGSDFTIACPAFPEAGRTIYQGHLFVGDRLLAETHMRHHPLTPMMDSDLVRVLGRQTTHGVSLLPFAAVRQGPDAIRSKIVDLRREGRRFAVPDVLDDANLRDLGTAAADLALVTGASGIAMGLPENFRRAGLLSETRADGLPPVAGQEIVLAGSCSVATLGQIEAMAASRPALKLEDWGTPAEARIEAAVGWARERLDSGPVLIYASAPPNEVRSLQDRLGRETAGALVEETLAGIAAALVASGVRRLVVAGGETAGAVVKALGIQALRIGPQIDPGVPACVAIGDRPLAIALKSGNFGGVDFFLKALRAMP